MNNTFLKLEKLLKHHKIEVTPPRIDILKVLIDAPDKEFTHTEILELVRKVRPSITTGLVASTVLLFKVRNIIEESSIISGVDGRKRGRPETKYRVPLVTLKVIK